MKCDEYICDICGRHVQKVKILRVKAWEPYAVYVGDGRNQWFRKRKYFDICDDCRKMIASKVSEME